MRYKSLVKSVRERLCVYEVRLTDGDRQMVFLESGSIGEAFVLA